MPDLRSPLGTRSHRSRVTWVLVASYVWDWICLIAVVIGGVFMGNATPNKRHFSLDDADIGFPFTEYETVTTTTLVMCSVVVPIVVVLIVALIFVPGPTVPKGTPQSLIWKRKLWEWHTGWLGLALSLASAWFITNGMKNLFGKPRPDLLSRCQPDLDNIERYFVGGLTRLSSSVDRLVSADICQNPDTSTLEDGFRSFPSGHSSSSAAGLIYLSLFLASKFCVTIPFIAPPGYAGDSGSAAFPSRAGLNGRSSTAYKPLSHGVDEISSPSDPAVAKQIASHGSAVLAVRRQAAAPPIYLLIICVVPFFLAVFIASSRWFDFRHHGFDILFGFGIGTITAFFSFRYYHLPISQGAGWAWAPRSHDKAFWAGIGVYSYATDKAHWIRPGDEEQGPMDRDYPAGDVELGGLRNRSKPTNDVQLEHAGSSKAPNTRESEAQGLRDDISVTPH